MASTLRLGAFNVRTVGEPNAPEYRAYLEDENGDLLSYFHDVPLYGDEKQGILNMVLEIPRWTNAKLEISTGEHLNPIKQDVKKGALRYVKNLFPFKGYPWNYGAFPQTWEDPTVACPHTGFKGDKDPVDVLDIGSTVGFTGQIKRVKVLGCIALLDEGETDWKVIAIDVDDPLASSLDDIGDVNVHCPGLLDATRLWFKKYKVPDGKPENDFAFSGEYKNKAFAMRIVQETNGFWKDLISGRTAPSTDDYTISCQNKLVEASPYRLSMSDNSKVSEGASASLESLGCLLAPVEITKPHYNVLPTFR